MVDYEQLPKGYLKKRKSPQYITLIYLLKIKHSNQIIT